MISKFMQTIRRVIEKRRETIIDDTRKLVMLGRDEYQYIEGDRSLIVFIELLSGKPERAIHLSSIDKWLPPHEGERITEEERQQIADRIAQSFTRRGRSVTIWSG